MKTKFAGTVVKVDAQSPKKQIGDNVSSALEQLLGDKKYVNHTVTPLGLSFGSLYFLVTVAYEE